MTKELGELKYGSGSFPQWKTGDGGHYPTIYRSLLEEHSSNKLVRANQVNQKIPAVDE